MNESRHHGMSDRVPDAEATAAGASGDGHFDGPPARYVAAASALPERLLRIAARLRRTCPAEVDVLICVNELELLAGHMEDEVCNIHRLENELKAARRDLRHVQSDLIASEARGEDARHTALHDPLTGLPNRHSFEEIAADVLVGHAARACEFSLLYIDLNGFKAINDTHGHAIGDELLKVIGSRLTNAVRSQDSVCRHGGDEFACLLMDIQGIAQVAAIADKLFAAVSAPCQLGSLSVSVTPSIGIALYPGDGIALDELLRSADSAMFRAKLQRLRHVFFNDSTVHQHLDRPLRRR